MKKAIVLLAVFLVLFGTMLPSPAWAQWRWYGGYPGGCCGWWWPGAIIGGVVFGAVAVATAPILALSGAPPYFPPGAYAPPVAYVPRLAYSPPLTYRQAPIYAPPQAPAVQREVVYPNGRYMLSGDGVRQPWRWVWVPSASPPQ